MQCQIDGCINSSHLLGALRKSSGKDEYPYHQKDILVGGSYGELVDSLVELQSRCDGNCVTGRHEESHSDGYFIKVINKNGSYQIKAEKDE